MNAPSEAPKETTKDILDRFDRELRISKSGCSVKCGDRIVAKMPVAHEDLAKANGAWQAWYADAEKLCDAWNNATSHEAEIALLKEENERLRLANIDCVDWYENIKAENKELSDAVVNLVLKERSCLDLDQQIATLQASNEAMRKDVESRSFEFWAIFENGKVDDGHFGIDTVYGINASMLAGLEDELRNYFNDPWGEYDIPANCTAYFTAKNVQYCAGQMTFPETCAWDFPPHFEFDVELIRFDDAIQNQPELGK